jgi:hypothetical protein
MAITVKPIHQNPLSDDPALAAAGYTVPSEYNAGSAIEMATARLLGRVSADPGPAEELTAAQARAFLEIVYAALADVRSAATGSKILTAEVIESAAALVTLTDAATIGINWDAFLVAQVTVAGNRAFGNPTNVQVGTTRYVVVKGSDATARTISFGTNYKGDLPTGTVTSTSWLLIGLTGITTSHVVVTSCKAL